LFVLCAGIPSAGRPMGSTHIYYGDGKGKTTAAIGFACRAMGAGLRVLFVQFMKDGSSSEIPELRKLGAECRAFGRRGFMALPAPEDLTLAQNGMDFVASRLRGFEVVVLDEALTASEMGLITSGELLKLFGTPRELVLTGRIAPKELIEQADYVTEIKKIKHPYDLGQKAKRGVEF